MTWIKDNKFTAALVGITLLGVVLLFVLGSKAGSRYEEAKEEFDFAASEAMAYERLPLYPRQENRDGKSKALDDYKSATEELQADFQPYRPKDLANISPQEFTDRLKVVGAELTEAFDRSGTKLPDGFFKGFERYTTTLARRDATGMLGYQLDAIRHIMLALAESGAGELKNLHRPRLPEEDGRQWQGGGPDRVARPLPLEITFVGPEKSARNFLSELAKPEPYFLVIRSVRISNTSKEPPRSADAKFERPAAAAAPAAPGIAEIFGAGFVLPPADDEEPVDGEAEPEAAPFAPPPPPQPADSSRILAQVLGNEEVQVFVRLDLMQFLPAKKLP